MDCRINGATVHFVEHGAGSPLVALHGAGVDHREIEAAVEAVVPGTGFRRIYPDLPGMGRSTADGLNSNDDVVDLLGDLIDQLAGGPALLLGHSYGAYLRVEWRPGDRTSCSAWRCSARPPTSRNVPEHQVVRQDADAYDELEPEQRTGFDEYFVVRTAATARRYRDYVVPGTTLVDEAGLGRIFSAWKVDLGSRTFTSPTLIAAGRRDSAVGYADAVDLVEHYPHGTLAVIEGAGHALMHERPELLAALSATGWTALAQTRGESARPTFIDQRLGPFDAVDHREPPRAACRLQHLGDGPVGRGEHDARTGVVALPLQLQQCAHAHDGEEPHAGKIDDHVTVGKRTQVITKLGDGREIDFAVDRDDHPVGDQASADDETSHRLTTSTEREGSGHSAGPLQPTPSPGRPARDGDRRGGLPASLEVLHPRVWFVSVVPTVLLWTRRRDSVASTFAHDGGEMMQRSAAGNGH